jgi:hypothetical protein
MQFAPAKPQILAYIPMVPLMSFRCGRCMLTKSPIASLREHATVFSR